MKYYEIFTTYAVKGQYMYTLPPMFQRNAFQNFRVMKITKNNKSIDFEIIRMLDGDFIKLKDTPKRKFKLKLYVINLNN